VCEWKIECVTHRKDKCLWDCSNGFCAELISFALFLVFHLTSFVFVGWDLM
jgi:hypothetical protein